MIPRVIIYALATMMIIALFPMQYGYYTLLRITAFSLFALLAYDSHIRSLKLLPWIFGFMAIIYNPVFKIHLLRETWEMINLLSAVLLIATIKHTSQKEIAPKQ